MKILGIYRFVFVLLLIVIAFYLGAMNPHYSKEREQKLAQEIKAQLRSELRAEIKNELLAEINQPKEQNLAQVVPIQAVPAQNITLNSTPETLDQAVRRVAREVVDESNRELGLTDKELDQYVASGEIESSLPIGSGFSKTPDMVLAQNKTNASQSAPSNAKKLADNKEDGLETVAGAERPESVERLMQQRGSMLLGKGKWVFEPSTSWAHFSSNKISLQGITILDVFNIGILGAQEVNRDVFIQSLGIKYGLLNNFQTEIKIPFRGEYDRITNINASNQPTDETSRGAFGLGDIDLSVSRQIGWEQGLMPDLIAAFGLKTTTGRSYGHDIFLGTGHYAFRSALIASKSSDPAVIFGSLSYNHNFARNDIDGVGDVKPGDSIGYSVGTAIALSYQTAINFSFDNSVVFKTKRNGAYLLDSFLNVANFRSGLNWAIDESKSVNFSVSFGLTKDSPDVTVDVGFPISF